MEVGPHMAYGGGDGVVAQWRSGTVARWRGGVVV